MRLAHAIGRFMEGSAPHVDETNGFDRHTQARDRIFLSNFWDAFCCSLAQDLVQKLFKILTLALLIFSRFGMGIWSVHVAQRTLCAS